MKADFRVVLDSCVLANIGLCDLFLRLAEKPRLLIPIWSPEILEEAYRVHTLKLGWETRLAESFRMAIQGEFPEGRVDDFQHIVPKLTNDPKDRHVLAAAIRSGSSLIVTFNLKDFPEDSLAQWSVEVSHPDDYLLVLYEIDQVQVVSKISAIAERRGKEPEDVLIQLGKVVPKFSLRLLEDLA